MKKHKKPPNSSAGGGKPRSLPYGIHQAAAAAVMLFTAFAAGVGLILIAGSDIPGAIVFLCAAVLVIVPSFCTKTFAILTGFRNRKMLFGVAAAGFLLSIYPTLCYFVSHDYQLSVYRYMKTTSADVYYFGGLEDIEKDYQSAEDYIDQMQRAPASIVLDNMSCEKLEKLSAQELKEINNESLWDYCGFDEILGTTPDEVADSMKYAHNTNAYDFTFDYRGLRPKNFAYMFGSPISLFRETAALLRDGTHSVAPALFIFFLTAQAFAVYLISLCFDVDDKGQLVYIYKKRTARNKAREDDPETEK